MDKSFRYSSTLLFEKQPPTNEQQIETSENNEQNAISKLEEIYGKVKHQPVKQSKNNYSGSGFALEKFKK